jgi:hypothetical protein
VMIVQYWKSVVQYWISNNSSDTKVYGHPSDGTILACCGHVRPLKRLRVSQIEMTVGSVLEGTHAKEP